MNEEQYNRISLLYQFLTKRFDIYQTYTYDRFHRCYSPNYYGVRDENLETLKHFENLTLREIFTQKHINNHHYGDEYLDSNLVIIEENRICTHAELGLIFLYLLIFKLQDDIRKFLELLNTLKANYKGLVREFDGGNMLKMKVYFYDEFLPQFEQIPNYQFIFHLFAKTNSSIMIRSWSDDIEINVKKINGMLESLNTYKLDIIDL